MNALALKPIVNRRTRVLTVGELRESCKLLNDMMIGELPEDILCSDTPAVTAAYMVCALAITRVSEQRDIAGFSDSNTRFVRALSGQMCVQVRHRDATSWSDTFVLDAELTSVVTEYLNLPA